MIKNFLKKVALPVFSSMSAGGLIATLAFPSPATKEVLLTASSSMPLPPATLAAIFTSMAIAGVTGYILGKRKSARTTESIAGFPPAHRRGFPDKQDHEESTAVSGTASPKERQQEPAGSSGTGDVWGWCRYGALLDRPLRDAKHAPEP